AHAGLVVHRRGAEAFAGPRSRPGRAGGREPRKALALALVALLVAAGAVVSAVRHAARARRQHEAMEGLRRQLAGERQAVDARLDEELRPLRARVEALSAERDALRTDLERAGRMAEAREADHARALEILRLTSDPPSEPPPVEPAPRPKPPESPSPAPTAAPPPKPVEPPPPPAAAPVPARRPAPVLPAPLEARIKEELDRLRKGAADRKAATEALLDLRRREPMLREALRWFLEEERDPRVQARLQYVLEAIELSPLWTRNLGPARQPSRTAVADASRLVVGSPGSGVVALEASSGNPLWTQSTPGLGLFPPVLAGTNLVSIRAATGSATWGILVTRLSDGATEALACTLARGQSRLETDGDAVVFAPERTKLECRDGRTGRKRWETATLPSLQAFAVGRGRVFFLDARLRVVCRSAEDGKELWVSTADADAVFGASEQVALARSPAGGLQALDAESGKLRWTARTPARTVFSLAASADGTAILRTYEGLLVLDLLDGRVLWSKAPSVAGAVPPVAFGGFVTTAVGSDVVFLDPRSGREVARRTPVPDGAIAALAACRDRLFVVTPDTAAAFELR
ncbi:MAG TPA: PQQ-binding-like beta-propeller repeat protein, partial [Planctomycetota bacterium]|nr:PQQ-binding-like beta-propeller repeat protein [Planctomycetota bacterium]